MIEILPGVVVVERLVVVVAVVGFAVVFDSVIKENTKFLNKYQVIFIVDT